MNAFVESTAKGNRTTNTNLIEKTKQRKKRTLEYDDDDDDDDNEKEMENTASFKRQSTSSSDVYRSMKPNRTAMISDEELGFFMN